MTGNARQHIDPSARIEFQRQIARRQHHGVGGRQGERRTAEFDRINAEEKVMHHRVADKGRIQNV